MNVCRRLRTENSVLRTVIKPLWVYASVLLLLASGSAEIMAEHQCGSQNSYLWRVDTTPPVYLFGTVHVPYTKLWDYIPHNAKTAFSASEDLCIELRLNDPSTISALTKCQKLPKSVTISQVLSAETYQRIDRYLGKIRELLPQWIEVSPYSGLFGGTNLAAESDRLFKAMVRDWEKKRPIWVLLMLSSLTKENIRLRTVPLLDLFLDNAAEGLGKRVQAVEQARDQCKPLNTLSTMQVELALRVQLDHLEPLAFESSGPTSSVDSDVHTYRCGDFEKLVASTGILPLPPLNNITNISTQEMATLQEMETFLYKHLVTARNRRMAKRLNALLTSSRNITYFFALGAGHFLGRKSIVHRLLRRGYTVEHIPVNDVIDGPALPSNIIALGDPGSVPTLMDIPTEEEENHHRTGLPTLGPSILADIWEEFVVNAPSWPVTWPTTPTEATTATSSTPTSSKQTRSNSDRDFMEPKDSQPSNSAAQQTHKLWSVALTLCVLLVNSLHHACLC